MVGWLTLTAKLALLVFLGPLRCAGLFANRNRFTLKSPAYDELYADGITAYSNEQWDNAVSFFEKAIADYRHEKEVKLHCRLHCRDKYRAAASYKSTADLELDYYRYTIFTHKCSQRCKEKFLGRRTVVSARVRQEFETRLTYGYLQFAYFKVCFLVHL